MRQAQQLLHDAAAILQQRGASYGDAHQVLAIIAARWSMTLGVQITPAQVALCMIDVKLARLAHDPAHADSAIDVAGYAALLREVRP